MTRGAHLEKFEGYSVNTNVILHAEPSPHIVLKQCRIKGLGKFSNALHHLSFHFHATNSRLNLCNKTMPLRYDQPMYENTLLQSNWLHKVPLIKATNLKFDIAVEDLKEFRKRLYVL